MNAQFFTEENKQVSKAPSTLRWFDSYIRYNDFDFTLKYYYGAEFKSHELVYIADDGAPIVLIPQYDYKFNKEKATWYFDHVYPASSEVSVVSHRVRRLLNALKDRVGGEVYGLFVKLRADGTFLEDSTVKEARPVPLPFKVELVQGTPASGVHIVLSAPSMSKIIHS